MAYEETACDANTIYRAYRASVKGSQWKEQSQRFMADFLRQIFSIQDDLRERTLENGPETEFTLAERGRMRAVTSLSVRDRIIRHVLCDDILMPEVRKRIIYDNGASVKGRGISFQRKRFEVHLRRYHRQYGNDGWILFGDFTKFYDNILHEEAKCQLMELTGDDGFVGWLLDVVFSQFRIDVSYMTDEEYAGCMDGIFNKLEYRNIPKERLDGSKWMDKSVNIGDQLSQVIGIYYPNRIDTYIKHVRSQKFYGRYMDDWYVMGPDRKELERLLTDITDIAEGIGIHINSRKTRIVKISGTYRYLQVRYTLTKDGHVIKRINPERATAMRRKLKKLHSKVEAGTVPYGNVENMFKSWMGSFHKLLSKQQRAGLIRLYEGLFGVAISVEGGKMLVEQKGGIRKNGRNEQG